MSAPVVIRTEAGIEYALKKLRPADIRTLCDVVNKREHAALLERLRLAESDSATKLEQLEQLDRRRQLAMDLVRSAHTVAGACEIIECSIAQSGLNGTTVEDLDLDPTGELQETALALMGVKLKAREPEADPTKSGSPFPATGSQTRG